MSTPYPHKIKTPLAPEDLLLTSLTCHEGLGEVGEMRVVLSSPQGTIDPNALLGKPVTVSLMKEDESERFINGYVTRFAMVGTHGRFYKYEAVVRPWLWFLTRTSDCRIFQDMKVDDIVKAVFADHGIANFEFKIFRSYRKRKYCVQYRETDFNFVQRLLEEEGIYYYFEHEDGQHKMILVDSASAHDVAPDLPKLPFFNSAGGRPPSYEHVSKWEIARAVQPGKYVITDYDFQDAPKSASKLKAEKDKSRSHDQDSGEMFDYPGGYYVKDPDGVQYVETRLEEWQARFETVFGDCNATALRCGFELNLEQHPRDDQNAKYLITSTTLHLQMPERESSSGDYFLSCEFEAIASKEQFRPARTARKPFVQGPQTAVVVGPSGEEIHTDKYGRVKVQFHWDRYGSMDEHSSCWVRVAQVWAGKNFGAMHIPRMGQEVIVDFLEGDPDRPIVTGRVYNSDQMPPWDLPANKTQSGILTRSSLGGSVSNANAIRFEDKKGSEQLWIHAEKNQDIEVENDETHWVGHDRKKTVDNDETTKIGNNRTETVVANEKIDIGINRTETVGANEDITIKGTRTEKVLSTESVTIGSTRTHTIGTSDTHTVGASHTQSVTASQTITVGAARTLTVGAAMTTNVGAAMTTNVGAAMTMNVAGPLTITAAAPMTINAPTGCSINAPAQLVETTPMKIGFLGFGMEYNGAKMEYSGLTTAMKGVDICIVAGLKMDSAAVAVSNKPMTLEQAATTLKSGAIHLMLKQLVVMG